MKLLTYDTGSGSRAGLLVDDRVVDVTALLGARTTLRDVGALLELGDDALDRLRAAMSGIAPSLSLASVRLRSPILRPPTVRDFMDYEGHASHGRRMRGEQVPEAWYRLPVFYFSNSLCIVGPEDEVPHPSASDQLDYEVEIGAVIGREGSDISEADGLSHIAGFTIFNDFSARDLQRDEMQIGLGPAKGKDSATSLGPLLVTTDELAPYLKDGRLAVRCRLSVNGDQWMDGDGGAMYHTWGQLVERASHDSRIVPGDVFGGGTVTGGSIGEAMHGKYPQAHYLQPGDLVEIEIEGLGVLRNRITAKRNPDPNYRFNAKPVASPAPAR